MVTWPSRSDNRATNSGSSVASCVERGHHTPSRYADAGGSGLSCSRSSLAASAPGRLTGESSFIAWFPPGAGSSTDIAGTTPVPDRGSNRDHNQGSLRYAGSVTAAGARGEQREQGSSNFRETCSTTILSQQPAAATATSVVGAHF